MYQHQPSYPTTTFILFINFVYRHWLSAPGNDPIYQQQLLCYSSTLCIGVNLMYPATTFILFINFVYQLSNPTTTFILFIIFVYRHWLSAPGNNFYVIHQLCVSASTFILFSRSVYRHWLSAPTTTRCISINFHVRQRLCVSTLT